MIKPISASIKSWREDSKMSGVGGGEGGVQWRASSLLTAQLEDANEYLFFRVG